MCVGGGGMQLKFRTPHHNQFWFQNQERKEIILLTFSFYKQINLV